MMSSSSLFFALLTLLLLLLQYREGLGANFDKAHKHEGILKPYDGQQISFELNREQLLKLSNLQPVVIVPEQKKKEQDN